MGTYTRYFALGDSMSIDDYPTCDVLGVRSIVPRLRQPIGAASLLFQNHAVRWPEFQGRDLQTHHPGIAFRNLARDGATIGMAYKEQLLQVETGDGGSGVLVTLTAGGHDLLAALAPTLETADLYQAVQSVVQDYSGLVDALRQRLPRATFVLTTLYDASDGEGRASRVSDFFGQLPVPVLERLNDHIRAEAHRVEGCLLADLHRHFKGRGISAPEEQRWNWKHSMVEPNARGASEIRRVWLEALGE